MTERANVVPYDCDPEPAAEDLWGGATLDNDADRVCWWRPVALSWTRHRRFGYRLRRQTTGLYPLTAQDVLQPARGGTLVRAWLGAELSYVAPSGTTVTARVHDGAGTSYVWSGAAWVAAGAGDWNTPAEVEAGIPSWTGTLLGLEWRLLTTDARATPLVYGGALAARLVWGSRSGSTVYRTLADSWADDLVHRVLLPWLAGVAAERTDERTAAAALDELDYSAGVGASIVRTVAAVYDLTADPTLRTPLAGTWDAFTKIWTPTAAIPAGHRYVARVIVEPVVAYQADRDLFMAGVPQLVLETVTPVRDRGLGGREVVRTSAIAGIAVPGGRWREYRATLLAQSDGQISALAVVDAVDRLLDGAAGTVLVSPSTGLPIRVRRLPELRLARASEPLAAAGRFDLIIDALEYHGAADLAAPLVGADGPTWTVLLDPYDTAADGPRREIAT